MKYFEGLCQRRNYGDIISREGNPLLVRRGGRDIKKNVAKPPLRSGRGGRVRNHFVDTTTLPAPTSVASRHFLTGAATPPREEGIVPTPRYVEVIPTTCALELIWESNNETVPIRHPYLRQCLRIHRLVLSYELVERKNVGGQRIHFVVGQ